MAESDGNLAENVEKVITELHAYLHSEMSVSESEEDGVDLAILVRNDAPPREDGVQVVFMGVGLNIIDTRDPADTSIISTDKIVSSRPSDRQDLRQRYEKGTWYTGDRFIAQTENEESFGEILFPGESILYGIHITSELLPYAEVKIEGSVSRRHLFHISKAMSGLEQWKKPPLVDIFGDLKDIDIRCPIESTISTMPEFGSKTTLEEIATFRKVVEEARTQIGLEMQKLNDVYRATSNQEIKGHMKGTIGQYITSLTKSFTSTLEVLSSGNPEKMHEAADSLKEQLAASEEVNQKTSELMARYGVSPEDTCLKQEQHESAGTSKKHQNLSTTEEKQANIHNAHEEQPNSSQIDESDDNNDYEDSDRTPNDDRSDSMNPNNDAYQASMDNRSDQMNPNNPAYHSSRGR